MENLAIIGSGPAGTLPLSLSSSSLQSSVMVLHLLCMRTYGSSSAVPLQDTRQLSMLLARTCSPSCLLVTNLVVYVVAN